jgi:hypothetical protein
MDQSNQPSIDQRKQQFDKQKTEVKKRFLGGAAAAAILGIIYFLVITNAESQSGEVRVHVLIAFVYNTMGKMGGTALFGGLTTLFLVIYFVKMAAINKQEKE